MATPIASPTARAVAPVVSVPTSDSPGHYMDLKGFLLGSIIIIVTMISNI
jgi:hypothetical protein